MPPDNAGKPSGRERVGCRGQYDGVMKAHVDQGWKRAVSRR